MSSNFRIIKFSPAPEFIDPVNIALVVFDEAPRIYYDESFRRLKCISPAFNTETIKFLLNNIESDLSIQDPANFGSFIQSQSAQLRVSSQRRLAIHPGDAEIQSLIADYLLPLGKRQRESTKEQQQHIESKLGSLLLTQLGLPKERIHGRAKPDNFLRNAKARNLLRSSNVTIKRVVDGDEGIVLVDGINLSLKAHSHIRQQSESVAINFYTIGKVQKELQEIEKRSVSRAAIVFGMSLRNSDSRNDFYVHQLEREADLLIDPTSENDLERFSNVCNSAIAR